MGYPHIRGTVAAAEWQPSFIHLWPGIGCPDFLRPFEDTPPPSAIVTLKYSYAHSGVAVGFFALFGQPRCRGPPHVSEICSQPNFRILWLAAKRSSRTAVECHRHGTQDDFHQSQGHRSRGGWKVRPDGRGCPENQIQLPNTTSDSSSRNHPAGGEREAGDVPETLQKKLLPGLSRLHLR